MMSGEKVVARWIHWLNNDTKSPGSFSPDPLPPVVHMCCFFSWSQDATTPPDTTFSFDTMQIRKQG